MNRFLIFNLADGISKVAIRVDDISTIETSKIKKEDGNIDCTLINLKNNEWYKVDTPIEQVVQMVNAHY